MGVGCWSTSVLMPVGFPVAAPVNGRSDIWTPGPLRHRHAGHADVVRELIDGAAGFTEGGELATERGRAGRERHHARLEQVARDA